jgi:hypothetical protein
MIAVIIWWFISAHKWFKGPKVNIEHQMLGREGNLVEGEAKGTDSGSDVGPVDSKGAAELAASSKPTELQS